MCYYIYLSALRFSMYICWLWWQMKLSLAGISNCNPQYSVRCNDSSLLRYQFLTPKSSYELTEQYVIECEIGLWILHVVILIRKSHVYVCRTLDELNTIWGVQTRRMEYVIYRSRDIIKMYVYICIKKNKNIKIHCPLAQSYRLSFKTLLPKEGQMRWRQVVTPRDETYNVLTGLTTDYMV